MQQEISSSYRNILIGTPQQQGYTVINADGKFLRYLPMTAPGLLESEIITNTERFRSLRDEWHELWEKLDTTFFLSWDWLFTWWETFSQDFLPFKPKLHIICWRDKGKLVALLPCYTNDSQNKLFLLGLGENQKHSVFSELLDVLFLNNYARQISEALPTFLGKISEEINLGPIHTESLLFREKSNWLKKNRLKDYTPVVLEGFQASANSFDDYLATLSSSTRSRVRRTLKKLKKEDVTISAKQDDQWFDELVELHQKDWIARGAEGAFRSETIIGFHKRLLSRSTPPLLLKLCSEHTTIGYIYGFNRKSCFEWYQMGINHSSNQKSPGFALHSAALEYFAQNNAPFCYDFLVGANQLKQNLGNSKYLTHVITATRPTFSRDLKAALARMKKKINFNTESWRSTNLTR